MITFSNVTKRFPPRDILIDISITINRDEHIGIVGPNGAGKSTFFNLITSDISPDEGTVTRPKDIRIGYVRQHIPTTDSALSLRDFVAAGAHDIHALHNEITLVQERMSHADKNELEKLMEKLADLQTQFDQRDGYMLSTKAEKALSGLGFDETRFDDPVNTYSGGWQMRAELARTLVAAPHLLLLDEPSNYLDLPAIEWLKNALKTFAGTFLMISHDRYLLTELVNCIYDITAGTLTRYNVGYKEYRAQRAARISTREAQQKNIDRKREQLERFVERFRAKNTKAAQAQSKMKQLDKLEDVSLPPEASTAALRIPPPPHCGNTLLHLDSIDFAYKDSPPLFSNFSFTARRSDRIAIVGYNGMGKTTLLRIIAGVLHPLSGSRKYGHNVIVGYQSQEFAETLMPDKSAFSVIKDAAPDASYTRLNSLLGSFGFSHEMSATPCGKLSGGEKIRLAFARIFAKPPNLLVLDEPTTHLDIQGRETLQNALANYSGTVCFVSHDVEFTRAAAKSIVALTPQGPKIYAGGYDYYIEKTTRAASTEQHLPAHTTDTISTDSSSQKLSRKEQRKLAAEKRKEIAKKTSGIKKRVTKLVENITQYEEKRDTLIKQLETATPADFESLNRSLTDIQNKIDKATQEWEEKSLQLDEMLSEI